MNFAKKSLSNRERLWSKRMKFPWALLNWIPAFAGMTKLGLPGWWLEKPGYD